MIASYLYLWEPVDKTISLSPSSTAKQSEIVHMGAMDLYKQVKRKKHETFSGKQP